MNLTLPPPSALNFLAGMFAGAGINMLTSVSTGPPSTVSTVKIAIDSACWVVSAGFLTWAAQVIEHGERDADLYIDRDFTEREKKDIREEYRRKASRRAWLPVVLMLLALAAAILLLPGLIRWR